MLKSIAKGDKTMNLRKKSVIAFLLSIALLNITGCEQISPATNTEKEGLNIHAIDVGQGESTLLECNGNYMLIDSGETDYGKAVVDYLKQNNVDKLSYMVITHPHSDHYGGAEAVLESIKTENIVMTEAYSNTRSWEALVDYIDDNSYNVIMPKSNQVFRLGECSITTYVPEFDDDNLNNCSVVLKAEYDGMSAIFTGDAEKSEEKAMLEGGFDVTADVLSVGHHGSSTSTGKDFLTAVNPSLALISCGKNNDYRHPHKETTALLKKQNVKALRTDEQGSIVVNMSNNTLNVATSKGYSESININNSNNTINTDSQYIGNKNSKVYHSSDCKSVKKMSEKNKVVFNSVQEAESENYSPCKTCNP